MTDRRDPDQTRIGILTTDTELIVRSWDAALARMTGIATETAIGQRLDELVPDLRARSLMDALREPLLSGSPVVLAPALHHYFIPCAPLEPSAEFDRMQQRVVIGALKNDEETIGVVVTIEDVTARLERERRLARQLRDIDPAHRLEAVAQLAADEHADQATLTPAITDDDWRVRRAAVKALSRTRNATLVGAVVAALRDGHTNFSFLSSALQLLTLSGVDLTDALIELLRDPDPDLRLQAALALGTQRNATAADALVAALDDPAPNVRFHAIEALGTLASPAALERLMSIAESGDFFLAFPAIESLVRINDPIVAARLVQLLLDPLLGGGAADALGQRERVEPLVARSAPEIPIVPVVSAIAAIHKRYGQLFGGAEEIEARVRQAISPVASRRILDALLQTSGTPLRDLVTAVGWLPDPSVPAALARFLSSHDASNDVIEALVRFGESAVDALIAQLGQEAADTKRASAIALGRIGDRRAVPALIALLDEDGRDVRLQAIAALGKIGDSRGFLPLLALLGDPDTGIRQAVIGALNSLGHHDMEGHILTLLQSPDARVRESAVKIAGYFGYPACVEMFLERCRDAHEAVRCAALEHLPFFEDTRTLTCCPRTRRRDTARPSRGDAGARHVVGPGRTRTSQGCVTDNDPGRYFAASAWAATR
jgi:HEAT repeat protein